MITEPRAVTRHDIIVIQGGEMKEFEALTTESVAARLRHIGASLDGSGQVIIMITPKSISSIQPEPPNEVFPFEIICPNHGRIEPRLDGSTAYCPQGGVLAVRNSQGVIEYVSGAREAPPYPTGDEIKAQVKDGATKAAKMTMKFLRGE